MNRFDMAKALVERAKLAQQRIGDDHGDPYEEVLLTKKVGLDFKVNVKEIFDHLRSALDYCAHEVCEVSNYGENISSYKIYFPIAKKNSNQVNFKAIIGKNIPGLLKNRIDLLSVFESFQPFYSKENEWISDFATLCNESKHQQLSIIECDDVNVELKCGNDGKKYISFFKKDGNPFLRSPLMVFDNYPYGGQGKCIARYICLEAINEEFLYFINKCIKGVENIISELEKHI